MLAYSKRLSVSAPATQLTENTEVRLPSANYVASTHKHPVCYVEIYATVVTAFVRSQLL